MSGDVILFKTDRFNLSEVQPHFINPCCFGEDLARWLQAELGRKGVVSSEPGQEDWGWYLDAKLGETTYFVGIGGTSDEDPAQPNYGEWRIIIEAPRTLKERLLGKKKDSGPLKELLRHVEQSSSSG